jgi:HK97 family phage major capsid protein
VTTFKADALIQASWELLEDTNLGQQVGTLFADAKTRLEAAAFVTGSGSGQPTGVVTSLSVTTASKVSAQTNASYGAVDLFALVNSLPARAQDNPSWLMHWGIANLTRQLAASSSLFWTDLGPGIPSQLLGRPVYLSSAMSSSLSAATASSDNLIVLSDFSQSYLIVDRIGMNVVQVPSVGSNRRPDGQTWIAAYFRTGGAVIDGGNSARLLVV